MDPSLRALFITTHIHLHATIAQALAGAGLRPLPALALHEADLVLLDASVPSAEARQACERAHEAGIPVLLLAASDGEATSGIEAGADEYVTIPCSHQELGLRVRLALRHAARARPPLAVGDLYIDPARHQVTLSGQPVALSATEFRLLSCLAANAGRTVPWQVLLREAWQVQGSQGGREMVKTGIYRLRRKLGPASRLILTVRSAGYMVARGEPRRV